MIGERWMPILVAIFVASALAVPVISITVQQLGVGHREVLTPVNTAYVDHVFSIVGGHIVLDKVMIKFDQDLQTGSYIRVELLDSSGDVLSSGDLTLASDLPAGDTVLVDLSPDLGICDLLDYDSISLLVAGPSVTT